jgi:signal transduction histidine kinase
VIMPCRGSRPVEEKAVLTFLAVYRTLALAVALTLIFSLGHLYPLSWSKWTLMSLVSAYTLFKVVRPSYHYRKVSLTYINLSVDLILTLSLLVLTGGLISPFLLYSISPILVLALLFPRKLTFSIVGLPAIAVVADQIFVNQTSGITIFYHQELGSALLGVYILGLFLAAWLPYVMNINVSQEVKAQVIREERKRLSRDMHDRVAQALGIIRWRTELLGKKMAAGNTSQALKDVLEIRATVEGAQREVKEVIEQLRMTATDSNQGFVPTLAQYATEFTRNHGIKCELHMADGQVNLPALAELELLCVAQEALTNVSKHAEASKVEVSFQSKDNVADLAIIDNGRGFDPQAVSQGYGLTVMQERVMSIGGELNIITSPGCGTEVRVKLTSSQTAKPGTKRIQRVHTSD